VQSIVGDCDGVTSVVVCDMPLEYEPTHAAYPKMMADAYLISCAPDLLSALKAIMDDNADRCGDDGNYFLGYHENICIYCQARAAIAKAEGK
jgi:hypothetical protein